MATMNLLLLPGDGIGPEVMAEVKKLIAWMNARGLGPFETEDGLVGGAAYDAHKVAITDATTVSRHADSALLSAFHKLVMRWHLPTPSIKIDSAMRDRVMSGQSGNHPFHSK